MPPRSFGPHSSEERWSNSLDRRPNAEHPWVEAIEPLGSATLRRKRHAADFTRGVFREASRALARREGPPEPDVWRSHPPERGRIHSFEPQAPVEVSPEKLRPYDLTPASGRRGMLCRSCPVARGIPT